MTSVALAFQSVRSDRLQENATPFLKSYLARNVTKSSRDNQTLINEDSSFLFSHLMC